MTYTPTISPVCLPPIGGARDLYEDNNATVIGWGSLNYSNTWQFGFFCYRNSIDYLCLCAGGSPIPAVLQEVTVRVTANSHCKESYKSAGFQIVDNTMLCAAAPGKDACRVHISRKMKLTFSTNRKGTNFQ